MSWWSETALLVYGRADGEDDIGSALVGVTVAQGVAQGGRRGAASLLMSPPEGLQEFDPRLDALDAEHSDAKAPVDGQRVTGGDPSVARPGSDLQRLLPRADGLGERALDEEQHG